MIRHDAAIPRVNQRESGSSNLEKISPALPVVYKRFAGKPVG
jgi:hypothetical protein